VRFVFPLASIVTHLVEPVDVQQNARSFGTVTGGPLLFQQLAWVDGGQQLVFEKRQLLGELGR